MQTVEYNSVRKELQTGDQVFFTGRGFVSWLIERGNRISGVTDPVASRLVHVGTVIRDTGNDLVLLSESTMMSGLKDVATGRKISGLHTVALSDRIREVGGTVYIRRLYEPLLAWQIEKIAEMRHRYKGRKYERKYVDLFRAAFDWFGPQNHGDTSSLFCSEWCAMLDIETGLLPEHPPADEYIPADLALSNGCRLPMVKVVMHG